MNKKENKDTHTDTAGRDMMSRKRARVSETALERTVRSIPASVRGE